MQKKFILSVIFFHTLLSSFIFFGGWHEVKAVVKEAEWGTIINGSFAYKWGQGGTGWARGLANPDITVKYYAKVVDATTGKAINDGSTIPVGTKLQLVPMNHKNADISWVGNGYSSDTPYGHWQSGAGFPGSCGASDFVGTYTSGVTYKIFVPLSINPPQISYSNNGTAKLSCNQSKSICTVTSPGSITASVVFDNTFGKFYYQYKIGTLAACHGNSVPMAYMGNANWFDLFNDGSQVYCSACGNKAPYILNVPSRTITFNLTAVDPNNPPNKPTIIPSGANTNLTINNQTFALSATDPDGDQVRYGIDWDNNNTVDQWRPAGGVYVNSGTAQNVNRSWATAGTYTFKVRTQDANGSNSGWTSHTITISDPVYVCTGGVPAHSTMCANDDTGLSVNTARRVTNSCTAPTKCEYTCTSGYIKSGNSCVPTQCNDGVDNDGDTFADLVDPGCATIDDNDETNPVSTATISATACDILLGGNSCVTTVSWNSSYTTNRSIRQDGVQFSTLATHPGMNRTLSAPGTYTFSFYDNGVLKDSYPLIVSCATGSWDGDSCELAATYNISYNGNTNTSGSAPAAQTKTHGVDLTLRNNTGALTKTNYTFSGWNTAAAGNSTTYNVGGTYSTDAALTLYAKWLPVAPTGNAATDPTCDSGKINLTWNSIPGVSGYNLSIDGGAFFNVGNVTTYSHTGLIADSAHNYRVQAWTTAGAGAASGVVNGVAPEACVVTCPSSGPGANVTWTDVSGTVHCGGTVVGGPWYVTDTTSIANTINANNGMASFVCNAGGAWVVDTSVVTPTCSIPLVPPVPPAITITATPALVRSGDTTAVEISTMSVDPLDCDIYGATSAPERDKSIVAGFPYTINQTKPINSKQLIRVECTNTITGATGSAEATIEVVPKIQEI